VALPDGALATGVEEIRAELLALGSELLHFESRHQSDIRDAHPAHHADAINLVH
jgi:hypothetical protein